MIKLLLSLCNQNTALYESQFQEDTTDEITNLIFENFISSMGLSSHQMLSVNEVIADFNYTL